MAQFKRVKSEVFEGGTAELRQAVEDMRSIAYTPVEREFDLKWAADLKTRIAAGAAVTFIWAVADMPHGAGTLRLRVNGQHSSWALAKLLEEDALPGGLAIHLDTYEVEDQAAAVLLFRQFDARKSSRSKEDISGAYQCWHEALRGCSRSVLKTAVEGAVWYRREVQRQPVKSGDDIYELFDETRLHPFFLMTDAALKGGKANELKRVPVMAAAFGTWMEDARQAAEFWRLTALGTKRNEEDAAADLDGELVRIREEREKVSAGDMYAKCAKAWIAFGDGARVGNFKVNTAKKGLPSLGELAA
jgi:hypothetical protein